MEKKIADNKNQLKSCFFKAFAFYTPVSLAYVAALALNTSSKAMANDGFALLLLKNLAVLLAFSLLFGFSFLIFGLKKLPNPAKWSLHIFILYVGATFMGYVMTGSKSDPADLVLLIFITAILFAVLYI